MAASRFVSYSAGQSTANKAAAGQAITSLAPLSLPPPSAPSQSFRLATAANRGEDNATLGTRFLLTSPPAKEVEAAANARADRLVETLPFRSVEAVDWGKGAADARALVAANGFKLGGGLILKPTGGVAPAGAGAAPARPSMTAVPRPAVGPEYVSTSGPAPDVNTMRSALPSIRREAPGAAAPAARAADESQGPTFIPTRSETRFGTRVYGPSESTGMFATGYAPLSSPGASGGLSPLMLLGLAGGLVVVLLLTGAL